MAFLEDIGESIAGPVVIGGALLLAAPIMFPFMRGTLKPLTKSAIRGGLKICDLTREWTAETKEQWHDMVAEVQAERARKDEPNAPQMEQQRAAT